MVKRRLSEQFREQLNSLGQSLAEHTRSLDDHFQNQQGFLIERSKDIDAAQQALLEAAPSIEDNAEIQDLLSPFRKGDFNLMTVVELKKFCTTNGIKKVSSLTKPRLLKILREHKVEPPRLPAEKVIKKLKRSELEKITSYFISLVF